MKTNKLLIATSIVAMTAFGGTAFAQQNKPIVPGSETTQQSKQLEQRRDVQENNAAPTAKPMMKKHKMKAKKATGKTMEKHGKAMKKKSTTNSSQMKMQGSTDNTNTKAGD